MWLASSAILVVGRLRWRFFAVQIALATEPLLSRDSNRRLYLKSYVASLGGLERALLRCALCNRWPETSMQNRRTGMFRYVSGRRSASGTCWVEAP